MTEHEGDGINRMIAMVRRQDHEIDVAAPAEPRRLPMTEKFIPSTDVDMAPKRNN